VLKNLSFKIKAGEKVGIVGRTGAGKSTITSSILRLVEPTEGAILIDGKNTMDMPLKDLRSSITLIAQEPVMIEGTLRENLDPRKEFTDALLLETLRKCCLEDVFKEREGLNTIISDAGDNLSIGEKQLVCIARAILRNSKLVLIDEATANIDVKADNIIQ
jgi:ABC-type multidrug transport system fused ATPase/permease subunit